MDAATQCELERMREELRVLGLELRASGAEGRTRDADLRDNLARFERKVDTVIESITAFRDHRHGKPSAGE